MSEAVKTPAKQPAEAVKTPAAVVLRNPSERARPGLKRFRIRADDGVSAVKYILAATQEAAEALYVEHATPTKGVKLVTRELPD